MKVHFQVGEGTVDNVGAILSGDIMNMYERAGWQTLILEGQPKMYYPHGSRFPHTLSPNTLFYRAAQLALGVVDKGWKTNNVFRNFVNFRSEFYESDNMVCQKEKLIHQHRFEIVRDALDPSRKNPMFSYIQLLEETHDSINMPKLMDRDLVQLFDDLFSDGSLNNTFFFLLGDHGFRGERLLTTPVGATENNMPGLIVIPPLILLKNQPNLKNRLNSNALLTTSHWDLHRTVVESFTKI